MNETRFDCGVIHCLCGENINVTEFTRAVCQRAFNDNDFNSCQNSYNDREYSFNDGYSVREFKCSCGRVHELELEVEVNIVVSGSVSTTRKDD